VLLNIPSATDFSSGICISFAGLGSPALPVVSASVKYDSTLLPACGREENGPEREN